MYNWEDCVYNWLTSGAVHLMGSLPLSMVAPSVEARPKSATLASPSSDSSTFRAARSLGSTPLKSYKTSRRKRCDVLVKKGRIDKAVFRVNPYRSATF